jgi:hypothetical protein
LSICQGKSVSKVLGYGVVNDKVLTMAKESLLFGTKVKLAPLPINPPGLHLSDIPTFNS